MWSGMEWDGRVGGNMVGMDDNWYHRPFEKVIQNKTIAEDM